MLLCSLSVSGSPVPTVSWVKDGAPLRQRSGVSTRQEGSLHVLCLESAHITDTGQYGCTAANKRGKTAAHWSLTVKRKNSPVTLYIYVYGLPFKYNNKNDN